MSKPHFLLVAFPVQGHINPTLHLARRLAGAGALVTFATSLSAYRRNMISNISSAPAGLSFASFSDGFDDGFKPDSSSSPQSNSLIYMSEMTRRGTETLTRVIQDNILSRQGRPFTCVVCTPLLSWVPKVAREFHLPIALLWIQPATVFDVYYYYFNGYAGVIKETAEKSPQSSIKLPGLPPLLLRDLPSFIVPSNSYAFLLPAWQEQIESLQEDANPTILVNTFGELEPEALNSIPDFKIMPIGPLIKNPRDNLSGFDDAEDDRSRDQKNYIEWLETKADSSVVYISFGTIAVLSKKQLEEISRGLIESGRPFLWVITDKSQRSGGEEGEKEEDNILNFREELDELGMVVSWCDQVRVLGHRAIGCFVTHCGWNSTLESLVMGVPMVAFPQWTDQTTNAMLVEECWRTGVRVKENEEGVVESREIRRCIEAVMAPEKAEEFRRNVVKWRDLAAEAVQEGGSSYDNLKAFVNAHI